MNEKELMKKMREKQKETVELPSHNFGRLTPFYKETVPLFKVAPWRLGISLSLVAAFLLLFLLGPYFIRLASLLSKGF